MLPLLLPDLQNEEFGISGLGALLRVFERKNGNGMLAKQTLEASTFLSCQLGRLGDVTFTLPQHGGKISPFALSYRDRFRRLQCQASAADDRGFGKLQICGGQQR